jgi:geranylgeranyl pyrophosphate synthase
VWAMVAWATKTLCKNFQTIGEHLGAAYQIRDDLLDIILNTGDETSHYDDKTKFSDIQEWQQTFFTHYILEQDNKKHIKTLERCWWKELSQEDITKLQEIFVSSWAIEYGKKLIDFHLNKATKLIDTLPIIDESYRWYYYEIINLLKKL